MSPSPRILPTKLPFLKAGARCDLCPCRELPLVPPEPVANPRLVMVGEAPGRAEEKLGRPFVGLSGKFVDRLLIEEAGLKRSEVHLTNAALCRHENEDETLKAAECCAPRLLRELAATPKSAPVALLGKTAAISVLGLKKILYIRGFVWTLPELDTTQAERRVLKSVLRSPERALAELRAEILRRRSALAGRTALPSIHPAFVLRSETWHPVIRADFRRLGRACAPGAGAAFLSKLADRGEHIATQEPQKLSRLGQVVSLDVETTHAPSPLLAELLCVGLSDGKRTVVLWPWKRSLAKPLSAFLATRKAVVGHNLMAFDKIVLEQAGVK